MRVYLEERGVERSKQRAVGGQVRGGGTGRTAMGPTTRCRQASEDEIWPGPQSWGTVRCPAAGCVTAISPPTP